MSYDDYEVWEVWAGASEICSRRMLLSEWQAKGKVENEARLGNVMRAKFSGYMCSELVGRLSQPKSHKEG